MDKFIDINLIDTLRSIMETNTVHYKTDFNYDIDTFTNVAKSDNPYEKLMRISKKIKQNLIWRFENEQIYS